MLEGRKRKNSNYSRRRKCIGKTVSLLTIDQSWWIRSDITKNNDLEV